MQVSEFKGPKGFALGITDAPKTIEEAQQSFREIKGALLAWKEKRGAQCATVMFTYVCNESLHGQIESLLQAAYSQEQQLSPLLQSVSTQVSLLKPSGKPVKEFSFAPPVQSPISQPTYNSKPWWKFW